jgi:hypothetical protein
MPLLSIVVKMYPRNIAVFAGAKLKLASKTAVALDAIKRNMGK